VSASADPIIAAVNNFPPNNTLYNGAMSNSRIDAKTIRRVGQDDRLFFVATARGLNPQFAGEGFTPSSTTRESRLPLQASRESSIIACSARYGGQDKLAGSNMKNPGSELTRSPSRGFFYSSKKPLDKEHPPWRKKKREEESAAHCIILDRTPPAQLVRRRVAVRHRPTAIHGERI